MTAGAEFETGRALISLVVLKAENSQWPAYLVKQSRGVVSLSRISYRHHPTSRSHCMLDPVGKSGK